MCMRLSSAVDFIAPAIGCSDPFSAEATIFIISFSVKASSKITISVIEGRPIVNVPVLSKIIASILCVRSNASALFIKIPLYVKFNMLDDSRR